MKKRILLLATVAAVMALMVVAMASAALAEPPASGSTGCDGGKLNANLAIGTGSPSGERRAPYRNNPGQDAGGTGPGAEDGGFDRSEANTCDESTCPE
jgi:hypothetical protein